MKSLLALGVIFTLAILTDGFLSAGDKGQSKPFLPKGTPAEQVEDLITQHKKALAAFKKLYDGAKSEEEKEKLEALFPDPGPFAELLLQIAEKNPNDSAAVDALLWAFRNGGVAKAKTILMRDHLLSPKIGPLCLRLRYEDNPESLNALRKVLAENPSKEAQAHAALALGIRLKSQASLVEKLQKADSKALATQAEELLERVIKDKKCAAIKIPIGDDHITLGTLAGRELFEMRFLQPGKVAPDIVGEDIDGKPMKLSDFRGKVILLDFWGFW